MPTGSAPRRLDRVLPPLTGVHPGTMARLQRLAAALAVAFVLVGAPGLLLAGRVYAHSHLVSADTGGRMRLSAQQGDTVSFALVVHDWLTSQWASDTGLVLASPALGREVVLIPPTARDWGDTVTVPSGTTGSDTTIHAVAHLPVLAGDRTLTGTGTLRGALIYPSAAGGSSFTEQTLDVDVPVDLTLSPPGAAAWGNGRYPLIGLLGLDAALGLFFIACAASDLRRLRRLAAGGGVPAPPVDALLIVSALAPAIGTALVTWVVTWADLGASGLPLCWALLGTPPLVVLVLRVLRRRGRQRRADLTARYVLLDGRLASLR